MKITRCVLLFCLLAFAACQKTNTSIVPRISFTGLFPDSVKAGSSEDTAYLSFNFLDGDGDLGNRSAAGDFDIFLKDSRNDSISGFYFPEIPTGVVDPKNGMDGNCLLALYAATLIPRADSIHRKLGDTVHYDVYVKDQAGHESNHFQTPDIYIRP